MTVDKILERLAAIGPARRGQITEQWYDKTGRNGKKKRQGPYYVWTRYDDGKKITERVPAAEIDRAKDELARGEEIGGLFLEFFRAKEAEACGDSQKKRRRRDVAVRLRTPPGVRGNPAQDRRGGGADVRLAGGDGARGRAQDGREVPRPLLHGRASGAAWHIRRPRGMRTEEGRGPRHGRRDSLIRNGCSTTSSGRLGIS